jgi:hypothetical protein
MILIRPLFLPLAMISNFLSNTNKKRMNTKLKKSLKWFLGVSPTTPDDTIAEIVKIDLEEWAKIEQERARLKWKSRMMRKELPNLPKYRIESNLEILPKEFVQYINLQNAFCKQCKHRFNKAHFKAHGLDIPTTKELNNSMRMAVREEMKERLEKLTRDEMLWIKAQKIQSLLDMMKALVRRYC